MFHPFRDLFNIVSKDIFTNKVFVFEPIRVVGIPSFILGVLTYLFVTIITVLREGHIDWIQWSTGFTALLASLIAIATAMRVKESTEVQPHEAADAKAAADAVTASIDGTVPKT